MQSLGCVCMGASHPSPRSQIRRVQPAVNRQSQGNIEAFAGEVRAASHRTATSERREAFSEYSLIVSSRWEGECAVAEGFLLARVITYPITRRVGKLQKEVLQPFCQTSGETAAAGVSSSLGHYCGRTKEMQSSLPLPQQSVPNSGLTV